MTSSSGYFSQQLLLTTITSHNNYFPQRLLHKSNHYTSSIRPVLSLRVGVPLRVRPLLTPTTGQEEKSEYTSIRFSNPRTWCRSIQRGWSHTHRPNVHTQQPPSHPSKQKQPAGRRRPCPNFNHRQSQKSQKSTQPIKHPSTISTIRHRYTIWTSASFPNPKMPDQTKQ